MPSYRFLAVYHHHAALVHSGARPQVLVLASFILTFVFARSIAYSIRVRGPGMVRNIVLRGVHVHHYVWGISLLLLSGYLGVVLEAPPRGLLAVLFGCGAALTLDEFAIWLHLEDVYWSNRGRRSIEVVMLTVALLAVFLMHLDTLMRLMQQPERLASLLP
jgi:hypothetical protein